MSFVVHTRTQAGVTNRDATIYVLDDGAGGRAEVWPALGFNCFHWEVVRDGRALDLLYADPALFGDGRPTRSGVPILFPFPNRIRDGRFAWDGRDYQLPPNDPAGKNAIHGFACRRPWRVVGQGADAASAWVTGEFQASRDGADCLALWPADYVLRVTIRLGSGVLRVEAEVENPDRRTLPFGLGYHPYFRVPFAPGAEADDCLVQVPVGEEWALVDSLPTGERRPLQPGRSDSTALPRRFGDLRLDNLYTGLPPAPVAATATAPGTFTRDNLYTGLPAGPPGSDFPIARGVVWAGGKALMVLAAPAFREIVLFTPPHRHAFCIEPYTCTTDAINLQARGVDAGLLTLPPGGRWEAIFEMRIIPESPRATS